ncbi:MaoC family dehydratase N-terminal domain-containing protein [Paraburkholderia bengalensis]|uniref:MaoC family dehydratase N-terminal domain-containing protein n=1 Tax=Paraburkholderia bengalensis TaxID=2747562 RepID=A0ABU8J319_9BURK
MAIDYHALKAWPFPDIEHTYTERDTALYALSVGFGNDPLDRSALGYTYGQKLSVVPTMAAILGFPGQWMKNPESGIDWIRVVHGEQRIRLHRPLPSAGTVIGRSRIKAIIDKGRGKGAQVLIQRDVLDKQTGLLLASVEQLNFCRGDGGFTENGQPGDNALPSAPDMPRIPPYLVCDIKTRPESALLYRLNGDPNPLHADPDVASAAGFDRPILHGLATYGIAGHAILRTVCSYDSHRLKTLHARFSAPVMPGETIRTEIWTTPEGPGLVLFRARSVERDVIVLNNGVAELA